MSNYTKEHINQATAENNNEGKFTNGERSEAVQEENNQEEGALLK